MRLTHAALDLDGDRLLLETPQGSPVRFEIEVGGAGPGCPSRSLTIAGSGPSGRPILRRYDLPLRHQNGWLDLYEAVAGDFGVHLPLSRRPLPTPDFEAPYEPRLTEAASPEILYGYGDPSVLRVEEDGGPAWYLTATSNDAANAFPILKSDDLETWRPEGFVFPEGRSPAWCLTGHDRADFWAPEMHRVGGEYWLVFTARERDRTLAIGLARAAQPAGPWTALDRPLLSGGVIDGHIVQDADGQPLLVWKEDRNEVWPRLLAGRLHQRPELIARLFPDDAGRRAAALVATLWPWIATLEPMEQFFVEQPLLEAVVDDYEGFGERLARAGPELEDIAEALTTPIYIQALSADGSALVGDRRVILVNDQPWEAHLIEGVWITRQDGRYHAFYAGNDFSTWRYGIGTAVAEDPRGPWRKAPEPLLRSSADWWAPGHPSVATGPDGRPRLFLHAYRPGRMGYKVFRAMLSLPLTFEGDGVRIG